MVRAHGCFCGLESVVVGSGDLRESEAGDMSLLENELVKKYFGDQPGDITGDYCIMAYRVLAAMQEPIKKGERYLAFLSNDLIREYTADCNVAGGVLLGHLRLPSRFQTPEKEPCSGNCDCGGPKKPTPDPVEVEINAIASPIGGGGVVEWKVDHLRKALHGLVQLARSTKEK